MFNNRSIHVYQFTKGEPTLVASGAAPASVDAVLAGNFTSTEQLPLSELLFYDAGGGTLSLFRVGAGASLHLIKEHGVSKRWDILVAGNFKGGGLHEVLLYDRKDGISKFIQFKENGDIIELGKQDWSEKWDIIIAAEFGIFGGDDLLFYDRGSGHLKIYECRDGQLTNKRIDTTIERDWDTVVAGIFRHTVVGGDDLFFYGSETGKGQLYEIVAGKLTPLKSYTDLPKRREVSVSGRLVKGILPHEILLYDRDNGTATVYGFRHPDRALELRMERELPSHAHAVVPCNFVKAAPDGDELLLCGVHNSAVYLGWGAYVDTTVNFNGFFDGDHTVMCWFMPQFVHANYQPVIAENGGGVYLAGLAAYGDGNVIFHKDIGTEFNKAGDPVFFVQVGSERRIYLAPEASEGAWIHLALVRKGNRFSLFLNGVRKTPVKFKRVMTTIKDSDGNDVEVLKEKVAEPDTEIEVPGANFTKKPSGTLRIGRRTSGSEGSKSLWQTYALVDDVAVFTKALTSADITKIISDRRLGGGESGLLACWPFDTPGSDAAGVFRTFKLSTRPGVMPTIQPRTVPVVLSVSASRSSDNDARLLSEPGLIKQCHVVVPLPFKAGEVWRASQGMNSELGSHSGASAFCYDLILDKGGTGNTPVFACVTGKVIAYRKDDDSTPREGNRVKIKYIADRVVSYLHLAKNSLNEVIKGGTLDTGDDAVDPKDDQFIFTDKDAPELKAGDFVGKVGPHAKHLHFGARGSIGPYVQDQAPTIPLAFRDFDLFDPQTNTWKPVVAGFLRKGDIFRKRS